MRLAVSEGVRAIGPVRVTVYGLGWAFGWETGTQ